MKRRLVETLAIQLAVPEENASPVYENMISRWGSVQYAQLSVLLVHLRYVAAMHQTHHWQAKGDGFYGDHKMFGELYETTLEHIDKVAERAVGLGNVDNVTLALQIEMLNEMTSGATMTSLPQPSDLARKSLSAEINFLRCAKAMSQSLKETGFMTPGLENLIAGIEDEHETHVYMLKQRCS